MTVEVSPLNVLGGAGLPPVTRFQDSFNRASGPLGQNWMQGCIAITPDVNNVSVGFFSITQATDLVTQALTGNNINTAGATTQMPAIACPIPLINNFVWGKTQYCQLTFKDYSSASNMDMFIGCFVQPSALFNGYFMHANLHVPFIEIAKYSPNAQNSPGSALNPSTLVAAPVNANAFASGDVIRMSVDLVTTPGSAIITLLVNGVQKAQVTDGVPLIGGVPGIGIIPGGGSLTTFFHLINFDGGIGV